jgi:hypothetical protein
MASTHGKRPRINIGSDGEVEESGREKRSKQQSSDLSVTTTASPQNTLASSADSQPQHYLPKILFGGNPDNLGMQPLAHALDSSQNLQLHTLATKWMNSSQLKRMVDEEGKEFMLNFLLTQDAQFSYRLGVSEG